MKVSVYLGSSTSCLPEFNELAYELGRRLALDGHELVYGGSDVGTMKDLADGAHSAGGRIVGVFPEGFRGSVEVHGMKVLREDCDELVIVADFAERKKVMEERGDCCVIMPGSFGTLDEMFTHACGRSIGKHEKPLLLLDHKGYYSPLKELVVNMDRAGFLKPSTVGIMEFYPTVDEIIARLKALH